MVNLTPTFELMVTLTPKPEARKRILSVAPSSATTGSGGQARQIQRRLGCQFVSNSMAPDSRDDLPDVPEFDWAAFRAEDHAAFQACVHLQVHFAPEKCTVIAVQRVPWLEAKWDFSDAHLHIKQGKTDYLFIWTGQGGKLQAEVLFCTDELQTQAMVRAHWFASPHHTQHVGSTAALSLTKFALRSILTVLALRYCT